MTTTTPSLPVFSKVLPMTLAIMLAAGWLAIFMRSEWRKRNWKAFGFLAAGYLLVALVALVYAAVPLFVE